MVNEMLLSPSLHSIAVALSLHLLDGCLYWSKIWIWITRRWSTGCEEYMSSNWTILLPWSYWWCMHQLHKCLVQGDDDSYPTTENHTYRAILLAEYTTYHIDLCPSQLTKVATSFPYLETYKIKLKVEHCHYRHSADLQTLIRLPTWVTHFVCSLW